MRVVVLGGYGNFGARVCRALAEDPMFDVLAAGRTPESDKPEGRVKRVKLDLAASDFPAALGDLAPDLVIHCAGPFQGQSYRAAMATIAAGAHYIDLADSREFVVGFSDHVDSAARKAGVLAISGASSVPALSSAVFDALAVRFATLEEIQIAIAPAQRAPRGAATIAGVFSYAGKSFKWFSGGSWTSVRGWQGLRRIRFAGLGTRWAAACEVPDLELFPARYPGVRTVEFRAALELALQHAALWAAAAMRGIGLPLPIERWAVALDRLASLMDRFGSERGGMMVSIRGIKADGSTARAEWHLVADHNSGPEIPCMAAILLARKLALGELSVRGALACVGLLTLSDFEREFTRRDMTATVEEYAA